MASVITKDDKRHPSQVVIEKPVKVTEEKSEKPVKVPERKNETKSE